LLGLILLVTPVAASASSFQWSGAWGDAADQEANCVAIDMLGNVIVLGNYDGSIDFGGGAVTCPSSDCLFLAKLDHFGNEVWTRSIEGMLELGTNKLGVDTGFNVYVANEFNGTIDMGGGEINAVGFRDGLVTKYDPYGNHLWTQTFGSANALVNVKAANADGSGNVVVAGTFTGTIDFGSTSLTANPFKTNMFVAKFHWSGALLWSHKYEGGLIEITALDTDPSGNVVITGYQGADWDFGGGTLSSDPYNVFLVKYDGLSGAHQWSHTYGSAGTFDQAFDVACDAAGNVFIVGHFKDPLDFGGGALTSVGGWDIFVAKFDAAGNHSWSRSFGGTSTDRGYAVSVDGTGNVIVGGHFFFGIDMGGVPLVADPIDYCIAQYDASGNHQWSQIIDVENLGIPNDKEYSISAAANIYGEIAFAGSFKDYVDCGAGNESAGGGFDTFVAKFGAPATGIQPARVSDLSVSARPNPFNPQTAITYALPEAGPMTLRIYDVDGRIIRTLVDGWSSAGPSSVPWNGRDDRGAQVASGVYFARLQAAGRAQTARLVLIK